MITAKVVLFISKTLKNGEHPLMIRMIQDRKPTYKSVGISCKKEWWDDINNRPHKRHPNRIEVDILINRKLQEVNTKILSLKNEDLELNPEQILSSNQKTPHLKTTVFHFFTETTERLIKSNRVGNANVFKDAQRALEKYRNQKDMTFRAIDLVFLNHFEEHLRERNVTENSISVYMRTLRALYNKAIIEGVVKKEHYPFGQYKISKLNTKTRKRALSKEDLNKLLELGIEKESKLFLAQQYFIFSFYTMGTNLVDMAHLKWSNIENGRLMYIRAKTGKHYNIKLLPPAQIIIDYFKQIATSEYIFPILHPTKHSTATQIDNRITKISKEVNKGLKKIALLCEIEGILTFYVARHSWATMLKRNGISTSIISEAMKHDTERTTQVYLDSFNNDILDLANESLLNS